MKPVRKFTRSHLWSALLAIALWTANTTSPAADVAIQRTTFQRALKAQARNDYAAARRLAATLGDYPLRPYLMHEDLRKRLASAPVDEVAQFLNDNAGSYLGEHLRRAWLRELAAKQRWSILLRDYHEQDDVALQCQQLSARLALEPLSTVLADVENRWREGDAPNSNACAGPFARLYASGRLTDAQLWSRISHDMDNGDTRLAQSVAVHFEAPRYRGLFDLWLRAATAPLAVLRAPAINDKVESHRIALYALARLARQDVDAARDAWQSLTAREIFSGEERDAAARVIALAAAAAKHPQRIALLDAVPAAAATIDVQREQLRAGIAARAWGELVRWTAAPCQIPDENLRWRYWHGRALQESGRNEEANALLRELAGERDYYGFLAADRLALDYQFHELPIAASEAELRAMRERPALQRAHEFDLVGLPHHAYNEWSFETKRLTGRDLEVAAVVASLWGRPDRAILILSLANAYDDLSIRFPLLYTDLVQKYATLRGLEPPRVLAIIRAESAFNPAARSPVGALGLMQLMPDTARETARSAGLRFNGVQTLVDPAINIALGTAFLRTMLLRYDGNFAMAAAAYNAGPGRVRQWQGDACVPTESWVETIPYTETRGYVRRALFYAAIYQRRLERPIMKLKDLMPPVPPRDARGPAACSP